MASAGLVIPGTRIETLDTGELAEVFAEDAWNDPRLMDTLVQALDRVHHVEMEEMAHISPQEIRELLKPIPLIWKERQTGKIVWALFRDERQEVAALIGPFLESLFDYLDKEKKAVRKTARIVERIAGDRPTKKDTRLLKEYLFRQSQDLKQARKECEEKESKIQKIVQERDRMKSELAARRKEKDELDSRLGKIQKELRDKEGEVHALSSTLEKMRQEQASVDSLRQELHHFERENRKQEHEINRLAERLNLLQAEAEAGKIQRLKLARDLEGALQAKLQLERELAMRQERESRLIADAQKDSAATQPQPVILPKSKGRRLGIFVDMQNILIASRRYLRKIDFQKLLDFLVLDRHLVKALAYVVEDPAWEQQAFFEMLQRKGFEVRTRTLIRRADGSAKGNWDTGIVVDAVHWVDQKDLDIVLVVSGDGDFIELFKFLRTKGVRVEAAGFPFNTAQNLPGSVDEFFSLGEDILKTQEEMGASLPS